MNMFNCFQAVAFYTFLPILIQWLYTNNYMAGFYIAALAQVISYVVLSISVSISAGR